MDAENVWNGRTAIVTGAGQGIGFEISRQLALRGVQVILNDNDEALAKKAAELIGEKCTPLAGDAADIHFIRSMVDKAVALSGRLDIVVANAGITLFGDFLSYTL